MLVVVAFFLKAAIVPFHAWAPDAYEGASVPVTAYMATIVKAGVLLAAVRLFGVAPLSRPMVDLLAILPLISIVWGNLAAMRQTELPPHDRVLVDRARRLSVLCVPGRRAGPVPGGALLRARLRADEPARVRGAAARRDDAARDRLDNLKGLFHARPYAAVMIAIAMLSLAGIPPFPGFVAKFLIFKNVIGGGLHDLRGAGPGRQLPRDLLLPARDPVHVHERGRPPPRARAPGRLALGAGVICLLAAILLAVFPGWVIGLL